MPKRLVLVGMTLIAQFICELSQRNSDCNA